MQAGGRTKKKSRMKAEAGRPHQRHHCHCKEAKSHQTCKWHTHRLKRALAHMVDVYTVQESRWTRAAEAATTLVRMAVVESPERWRFMRIRRGRAGACQRSSSSSSHRLKRNWDNREWSGEKWWRKSGQRTRERQNEREKTRSAWSSDKLRMKYLPICCVAAWA